MTIPRSDWAHSCYPSGTQIVKLNTKPHPHYYVYASERHKTAQELRDWLNGGKRMPWMDNLVKSDKYNEVRGPEGVKIYTTGPYTEGYFDNAAGGKTKGTVDDPEFDIERAQLIYFLMTGKETK